MNPGLVLLHCETSSTKHCENFCNKIKQEVDRYLTHIDLEAARKKRKNALVVGKIMKILYSAEKYKIIILVKEVLPNFEYGQKFNAAIHHTLAEQFTKYALKPGDSLAFYEPFIFLNPAFQPSEAKYLLEIGGLDNSKMWCAKSQSPLEKNKMSEKRLNQECKSNPDKKNKQATNIHGCYQQGTLRKNSGDESVKDFRSDVKASNKTNNKNNLNPIIARKNENEDKNAKNINILNIIETDSPGSRQRSQIPLNPQIPLNTKRLNPQYTYKTLQEVRSDALLGEMGKVNIFVVMHQIVKGLAKTSTGRFSLRCKVIDESTGLNNSFHLNFFTEGSSVIQDIEKGDILRLHRVQVEMYQNTPDGRIFNDQDILLFKNNSTDPKTTAKNYQITEEDKTKLERLRKWQKDLQQCSSEIRLLGSIQKEGEFHIVCQLVSLEPVASGSVKLRVADGSVIRTLAHGPAPSHLDLISSDQATGHLVTEIEVCNQLNLFANLKAGTFLHLCQVKAVKTDKLRLKLNAQGAPMLLSEDSDKVVEIKQRLEVMKGRIKESVKNSNEKDNNVSPNNQQSSENNSTHRTRNRASKFSSSDCNKVKSTDACTKQVQMIETTAEVSGVTKMASEGTPVDDTLITALNQLSPDKGEDLNSDHKQLHKMSPCTAFPRKNVSRHHSKALQMKEDENGLKRRKPLFTANYRTDLSDATDDLSEVVESGSGEKGGGGVTGPEVVVVPVNTSFVDVMQLLETKCSPRKRIQSHSQIQNSQERKTGDNFAKEKYPYVKLIKLDNECNYSLSRAAIDKSGTSSRSKKLSVEDDDVNTSAEECIEIASTVKNMSYQKVFSENTIKNKNVNTESLSTQDNAVDLPSTNEDIDVSTIPKVQIDQKVSHWLSQYHGDVDQTIELDSFEAQKILLGLDEDKLVNMSEYIRTSSRRLRVFLERIIPNPLKNPFDLVSGVCVNGCKEVFIYSKIDWQMDSYNYFPLCPNCKRLKLKNNLLLTLIFELEVFDGNGHSDVVIVGMDEAETFLNCSTKDFLKDSEIRKSCVQRLTDSLLQHILNRNEPVVNKPLLDLSVVVVKNRLVLVNTTLKLPSTP